MTNCTFPIFVIECHLKKRYDGKIMTAEQWLMRLTGHPGKRISPDHCRG